MDMAETRLIAVAARSGNETAEEANWRALRAAWQPIAAGFKAIWWKAVALPEDVFDEDDFRASKLYHASCVLNCLTRIFGNGQINNGCL